MALTEDRLRTADLGTGFDDVDRGRAQERDEPLVGERLEGRARDLPGRPEADLFRRWSHRLLAAWAIVLIPLLLVAPAPDDSDAALSWGALLVTSAFTVGLVATLAGLGHGASWGFKASGGAAALGITFG
ncbi:MAG: hypothetical protein M3198_01240, partial [Actinomycetota bacterium]|nr:hypothetical protein [Actinomycetota bacterium]